MINKNKKTESENDNVMYAHTGKPARNVPLHITICLVVIFTLVAVLATFSACEMLKKSDLTEKTGAAGIELSAQCRVRGFYEKCGYAAEGEIYLDEFCEQCLR